MKQTLHSLKINDILYTKDGRKSGNLVVVDIEIDYQQQVREYTITYTRLTLVSDYGNLIYSKYDVDNLKSQFYINTGVATETHKHYNYKENHPEMFI